MSARVGYGQRRVKVTPEAVEGWLIKGGMVHTDLPNDARFLRVYPAVDGSVYYFVFESEEWEEVPEGVEIPEMGVRVREQPITLKVEK